MENIRDNFTDRLKIAMGAKSARAFALECGISPTGFHQNLTGKTEPSRSSLISIARVGGVSVEWLLTGEGFKNVGATQSLQLLQQLIEIIEIIFQEEDLEMSPNMKAEFICMHFKEILEEPAKIATTESEIRKFIKYKFK